MVYMPTLTRKGHSPNDLEDVIGLCSLPLERINSPDRVAVYMLFIRSQYLLIVSQIKDRKSQLYHNVTLTIASHLVETNTSIADQFEAETGIVLDLPVPAHLRREYQRTILETLTTLS